MNTAYIVQLIYRANLEGLKRSVNKIHMHMRYLKNLHPDSYY